MDFLQIGTDMTYDFASAKAWETYNKQTTALRESLLGNKVNYEGGATTDADTKKFYEKVLVYSTALKVIGVGVKTILDKLNDKTYEKQATETEAVIKSQEIDAGVIEGNIEDYYKIDVPARKAQLEEYKYKTSFGDKNLTNAELEEKNKKLWENNNKPDEISKELKDSGFESNEQTFPKPGEELTSHNTENGIKFVNRASFEVFDKGKKEIIYKGWTKFGQPDPDKYSTPSNPMSEKVGRMLEEYRRTVPGSYKFFIEKLHGKSVDGNFFSKNPITIGKTRQDYPNRMVFPAYIMAFNDSYQAAWSDYSFIGRGEKVWIYQNTGRELTVEFYMVSDFSVDLLLMAMEEAKINNNPVIKATADSKLNVKNLNLNANTFSSAKDLIKNIKGVISPEESLAEIKRLLPDWGTGSYPDPSVIKGDNAGFVPGMISGTPEMMWARLTFLAQCIYPWYRKDGKLKEQPFIRIRIGDFIDAVAKINGLTLNEYNEFDIDLNPSVVGAIPMGVRVVLNMTIVHEDEPNSNYTRFYWRRDFDNAESNYVPDCFSETSKTLDFSLDNQTPGSESSTSGSEGLSTPNSGLSKVQIAAQEELKSFKSSLKGLNNIGSSSVASVAKTNIVKKALLSAKRLLDTKTQNKSSLLTNINEEQIISASDAGFSKIKIKKTEGVPEDSELSPPRKKLFS